MNHVNDVSMAEIRFLAFPERASHEAKQLFRKYFKTSVKEETNFKFENKIIQPN